MLSRGKDVYLREIKRLAEIIVYSFQEERPINIEEYHKGLEILDNDEIKDLKLE
jgi:hypothetical protein